MLLHKDEDYQIVVQEGPVDDKTLQFFADNYDLDIEDIEDELLKYEAMEYDDAIMFLLLYDGSPVGVLCGYREADMAVEEHFFILPEHRGKKRMAFHMMKFLRHWASFSGSAGLIGKRKGEVYEEVYHGN